MLVVTAKDLIEIRDIKTRQIFYCSKNDDDYIYCEEKELRFFPGDDLNKTFEILTKDKKVVAVMKGFEEFKKKKNQ